jgi:hypothetical protein
MKKISGRICCALAFVLVLGTTSCDLFNDGPPYFDVITTTVVNGLNHIDPNVQVRGNANPGSCPINTTGFTAFGIGVVARTDSNGTYQVANAAIGCQWNVQRTPTADCPLGTTGIVFISASGQLVHLPSCKSIRTFLATPDEIDLTSGPPPATFDITGDGMDATYATPIVRFYDQSQTLWLEVTAVGTSADGTWLRVPSYQINFPDGTYAAVIYSMQADGTWNAVGGADISVFNPPPPPPDPCSDPNAPKGGNCPLPLE